MGLRAARTRIKRFGRRVGDASCRTPMGGSKTRKNKWRKIPQADTGSEHSPLTITLRDVVSYGLRPDELIRVA